MTGGKITILTLLMPANSPSSHETQVVLQGGQGREATNSRVPEGM